jgi:hypothetical protein
LWMPHPTSCTLFTKALIKGVISWFQTSEQFPILRTARSRLLLSLKNSQFFLQRTRRRRPTLSARRRFLQRRRRPTLSVRRRSTSLPPRCFPASPSAPPRRSTSSPAGSASRTTSCRLDGSGWSSPDGAPAAAVFGSSARRGPLLAVTGHRYRRRYKEILQGAAPSPISGQSLLPHSYAPSSRIAARGAHACFDSDHRKAGWSRGASLG